MAQKPDEDSVKLFVGQVPRGWGLDELRSVLMEAGHVHEVNIVRDRESKESKGCAFALYMTRAEADNAIKLFHGTRLLPGAKGPMQVKYADGQQVKVENKLFVGMLPKTVTSDELRSVFSPFGTVVDINVLHGPAHVNKGSAFIKFETYAQAAAAIEGLNGKHKMEGSNNLIAVKWADSDKEKEQRRAQKHAKDAFAATNGSSLFPPPRLGFGPGPSGVGGAMGGTPPFMFPPQHIPGGLYGMPPMAHQSYGFPGLDPTAAGAAPGMFDSGGGLGATDYSSPFSAYASAAPSSSSLFYPGAGASGLYSSPGGGGGGGAGAGVQRPDVVGVHGVTHSSASAVAAAIREKMSQIEGPPGANMFVYNIPTDWRDPDLLTAFSEFGNVLSTKVVVDKLTGQSKGFGVVSYQAPEAAEAAIAVMDGFMVGGKRLRVSLKRGTPGASLAGGLQSQAAAAAAAAAAGVGGNEYSGGMPPYGQQQQQQPKEDPSMPQHGVPNPYGPQ